ncbi:MAG TPA: M14-type cytosolic carboxypeptidase [Pirellulales bacterium]
MKRLAIAVVAALILPTPLQAAEKSPELQVSTNFPGGSGEVESIDQASRTIRIKPTAHPDRGWDCWWCFKVSGIKPGETLNIDLGGGKEGASFALADQATFTIDGKTWLHTEPGKKEQNRIVYQQRIDATEAYFAWGPPFTGDDATALIAQAVKKCKQAEAFELCRSAGNRPVVGLHIAPAEKTAAPKHGIWITARQHAWESGGSWVCRGLVEWLVSDDPHAIALRNQSEFHIIPIVDIDNVTLGAGGKEEPPEDHNRDWTDKPHHPAVAALQREMLRANPQSQLQMYIDLHNPSPGDKSSYFFISPRSILSEAGWTNIDRFLKIAQIEMTGPLGFHGEFRESGPNYDARWKQIGKNWVTLHTTNPVVSVTLETAWNTPASTAEGYQNVGRQLGMAIERYFSQSP